MRNRIRATRQPSLKLPVNFQVEKQSSKSLQEKRENLKLEGDFEFPAGKAVYCKGLDRVALRLLDFKSFLALGGGPLLQF